ncbi:MAG: valine--tRNA ligase [Fimbriimonas sp.]|nr:valine--tRNA ligase [Fimbriimonas sp.]
MDLSNMPTRYDASLTEHKWYQRWESAGLFQPSNDPNRPVFTITIPPPNITGSLHMGHALCYPIQDLLGRYHRLLGKNVLILPGQDHAGIATQSVVDKQLRKQGTSSAQIGRDKFVEKVWEWRQESGDTILHQLRTLGCAFDWTRQRFTLDEKYAEAVLTVFIDWYRRGLIFRGKRVVNWDPKLQTSVSDIETLRETRRGKLYHIRYPYTDGSGEIVIATTRPETMLADVAVAVHPSDTRYKDKVGKTLLLPLVNREIPVIADPYPDPTFGTGAVKITPAHDPNDYHVGVRHSLEMPVILDPQARICLEGPYCGMDRNEARKQIVHDLEQQGFLVKIEDHEIPIVISDRSGEVIEPLLSEQWFCDQAKLAEPVIEAIQRKEVVFHPERYERIFLEWMQNIREWCLSRQLWWGHRIPVYYTEDGTPFAALNWDDAQKQAGEQKIVRQDEDVLDTWFSSGLWPFATLGWPEKTEDLQHFYPTSCLVTDRNIINLWVARMMMMGYDLAGARPFGDVMIYATVMREDGRRMSKSLGTGIDPMEVIEKLGADALRYTLLSQTGENQELRYSEKKTEEARNFCNKIWNATRFALMNVEGPLDEPTALTTVDKWLLSRLYQTETQVREAYDSYNIQAACQAMYRFFWSELCDWYIEVSKPRLNDPEDKQTPQWVLLNAIDAFLKMMHPVMPHLTEELYEHLPVKDKAPFLMVAAWPRQPERFNQPEAENQIERIFAITRAARALRVGLDLASMKTIPTLYIEGDLQGNDAVLASQAWVTDLVYGRPRGEGFVSATAEGVDIHLPIAGLIDAEKELSRLAKEEERTLADLTKLEARLSNPQFVERAKPEIVEKEQQTALDLKEKLAKIQERRKLFQG